MYLKGKYTVPEHIGVPLGVHEDACVDLKDDTLTFNGILASAVFTIFSDQTKINKLFDFVVFVDMELKLSDPVNKPTTEEALDVINKLVLKAREDMCRDMSLV